MTFSDTSGKVPNVPCGVERIEFLKKPGESKRFLMYRVELKVGIFYKYPLAINKMFLMYRVELKVSMIL